MNGQGCIFKIDTGSDVSILNRKLVRSNKQRIWIGNRKLRYPIGEKIPIDFKVLVQVELGKFSLEFPMFVIDIEDAF
ncbi:hypothetical protein P5V15_001413 [Pogonomyrmex californicus]